jgi:hypothetical protein
LIRRVVFEVLTMMKNSGSTLKMGAPCPFGTLAPIYETTQLHGVTTQRTKTILLAMYVVIS